MGPPAVRLIADSTTGRPEGTTEEWAGGADRAPAAFQNATRSTNCLPGKALRGNPWARASELSR